MSFSPEMWKKVLGTFVQLSDPELLVKLGENTYVNFGDDATPVGVNGYGVRDNLGTVQVKHLGGEWADIGSSGGSAATSYKVVVAATTANITIATALNSGDVIDGITLANGDAVLVKDQTATATNGVYIVATTPARWSGADTSVKLSGMNVVVQAGTVNADTSWLCTFNANETIDTDPVIYQRLNVSGELLIANNLSDIANAATARTNLNVDVAGTDNSTNVSLAGAPDYITIVGQVITRALVNLSTHITGTLGIANGGTGATTASDARTNLGLVIGTDVQAQSSVLSATTASFTTADETKLDGIESGADITDATNVGTSISGATEKTTPVGGDLFAILDSAASNVLKKLSLTNLVTFLSSVTQTFTNKTLTSPVINTPTGIVKGDVGLGNVDNTSDASKPVSTATQTALDLKSNLTKTVNAQTGTSYTLVASDKGKIVTMDNASANTLTVPNSIFAAGDMVTVKMLGAGVTTIVAGSGTTGTDQGGDTLVLSTTKRYRVILFTSASAFDII